ncbi:unnamed protein product [Spirodela intermedia]|uniref:Uncharacterized protein n=1 Tax=Spirodela intermedia TaxID=51605 RepID=A0A7I8IYJ1_SPIIN|nr:unnamed protein product [Spirodela intermedia]CAA6662643.1 unnamed protein product [Spirodela intermedia]
MGRTARRRHDGNGAGSEENTGRGTVRGGGCGGGSAYRGAARAAVAAVPTLVEARREAIAVPGRCCKIAYNRTASDKLKLRRQ